MNSRPQYFDRQIFFHRYFLAELRAVAMALVFLLSLPQNTRVDIPVRDKSHPDFITKGFILKSERKWTLRLDEIEQGIKVDERTMYFYFFDRLPSA